MYRKSSKKEKGRDASTVQRQVANERERKRMQTIGSAFDTLKKCIPWIPTDTKLSKADTLRLAALYMDYLSHILRQDHHAAELTAAIAMQLSKADTLRLAPLYMDYLSHILRQDHHAAELTAAIAMQKWPWQKTAFQFDEYECGRSVAPASAFSAHTTMCICKVKQEKPDCPPPPPPAP